MKRLNLEGDVDRERALLFAEELSGLKLSDVPVEVELGSVELEDAAVVALLADGIRKVARRVGLIRLLRPPQTLAHTLYRIGALGPDACIEVLDPREELGTSS